MANPAGNPTTTGGSLLGLGGYGSESGSDSDGDGSTADSKATIKQSANVESADSRSNPAPLPLLDGWQEIVDASTGGTYYWNTETSTSYVK